jgi:replicative DNA helicase
MSQIAVRSRRFVQEKRRAGMELGAVVIDYLGLIKSSGRQDSYEREVSDISAGCKALAKELELPVIVLAQLNRMAEGRENKRPQLADLRGSGSIEQDADMVIGLFREEYYLQNRQDLTDKEIERLDAVRNRLEIIVQKARMAKPGTVIVDCDISTNSIISKPADDYADMQEEIPL